jgi:hypothetical protein
MYVVQKCHKCKIYVQLHMTLERMNVIFGSCPFINYQHLRLRKESVDFPAKIKVLTQYKILHACSTITIYQLLTFVCLMAI